MHATTRATFRREGGTLRPLLDNLAVTSCFCLVSLDHSHCPSLSYLDNNNIQTLPSGIFQSLASLLAL